MIIPCREEFLESTGGTVAGYYAQFDTAREIQLGGQYLINKGNWQEAKITIVAISDGFAFGVSEPKHTIVRESKSAWIFHAEGYLTGWRYCDPRPNYRLRNIG